MDENATRDQESQDRIKERHDLKAELQRQYEERLEELKSKAAGEPWDYIPETHDDVHNPAKDRIPPLWEAIAGSVDHVTTYSRIQQILPFGPDNSEDTSDIDYILAKAIGRLRLRPFYWSPGVNDQLSRKLTGEEATRLYLYYDLTPVAKYRVGDKLNQSTLRESLGIDSNISSSTIKRMPGRMNKSRRKYYASQAETLVRQWQGTGLESLVREPMPETVSTDGKGLPPIQAILQDLRAETFKYLRLKRDSSIKVTKDASLRVLIAAANGNGFVNDAAKNLKYKPFYDDGDIPTGQNLTHHLRKSSRESVLQMFREANEHLFDIASQHDYFPDTAEVAFDITDWPFYGDNESNEFIRGTKPGRNHSWAWKYITLALVGTNTPLILAVLPVKDKSKTPQYIRRMLRLSRQHLDIGRVYLDAGTEFYNSDTISTISEQGLELVMQGRKSGETVKHFLNGMARADLRSSYHPYGVGDLDEDSYYAVGLKSDKTVKLRNSDADEPMDDYTYFYTNLDPEEVPPKELGAAYRRRWGIETDFRVIKEEFLAKCQSRNPALRAFYFNFAAHLFNIWTVANILRAEETGADLSEEKQLTAGELMQAIEDDPNDLQIPTEPIETPQVFGDILGSGWDTS